MVLRHGITYSFQHTRTTSLPSLRRSVLSRKGPLQAIKIARASGYTLKMAGKMPLTGILSEQLESQIDGADPVFSEVSHEQKVELLSGATVTLFPITWREPFGLVMIESMATGTPVIGMVRARNHRPWEILFATAGKND